MFHIITLFPEFFKVPLKVGVLGRAISQNLLKLNFVQLRDFAEGTYQSVDDTPFGGGDGMLLQYAPLKRAIESITMSSFHGDMSAATRRLQRQESSVNKKSQIIYYLSPKGNRWDYAMARKWAEQTHTNRIIICGRYGGVDERIIQEFVDEEISVGDYVLTSGEPAALLLLDSICRFIPGALGNKDSASKESFEINQLLECPQWTRPRNIQGHYVPEILFSGHHQNIIRFQYFISVLLTAIKRPDLLANNSAKKDLPDALQYVNQLSEAELSACGISSLDLDSIKKLT